MAKPLKHERGDMDRVRYMYVGQVFKSYRDLCKFLNADILAGNSKNYQLEFFGKYFKWERDKNRYIITEIFDEPKTIPFFKTEEHYTYKSITVMENERNKAINILRQHGIKVMSDEI